MFNKLTSYGPMYEDAAYGETIRPYVMAQLGIYGIFT